METVGKLAKMDSLVLADFVLKHFGPMSHLKLQKILFYCDAYHLAVFGDELITDEFEAWVHGPVSRTVYNSLKDKSLLYADVSYESSGLDPDIKFDELVSDQKQLITDIVTQLSLWSAFELETATHRERPWVEARIGYGPGDRCTRTISKETTMSFYKTEIHG